MYVIVLTLITLYATFHTPETRGRDLTLLTDAVNDTEPDVASPPRAAGPELLHRAERAITTPRVPRAETSTNRPRRARPSCASPASPPPPGRHHVVQDTDRWLEIADPFAAEPRFTGNEYPVGTVRLLAPVQPLVVLGMAHNGPGDRKLPRQAFLKSPRTVVGPDDDILVDERLGQVNVEGELAVVIRHPLSATSRPMEVPGAILGYTIGNDVTAVDQVALDEKMTQAKHGDGFTPIGPWIETDLQSTAIVSITVRVER